MLLHFSIRDIGIGCRQKGYILTKINSIILFRILGLKVEQQKKIYKLSGMFFKCDQ